MALRLAQARFREFFAQRPESLEDRRALRLLDAALADPDDRPHLTLGVDEPTALLR
jgi:hypothetical protein